MLILTETEILRKLPPKVEAYLCKYPFSGETAHNEDKTAHFSSGF
jgi:hypothetical protein